eukprot:m.176434 g.176434  ORF g.176434 m.176434 type:complete len:334 (+) comp13531_c0_seq2:165-1166(+)
MNNNNNDNKRCTTSSQPVLLLSPLSKRACFKLNIKPSDLLPHNVEDFVSSSDDTRGFHQYRQAEETRLRMMRLVLLERNKLEIKKKKHSCAEREKLVSPTTTFPSAQHPLNNNKTNSDKKRLMYSGNTGSMKQSSTATIKTSRNKEPYHLSLKKELSLGTTNTQLPPPMMTGLSIRKQILLEKLERRKVGHMSSHTFNNDDFVEYVRGMDEFGDDDEVCRMVAETRQLEYNDTVRMEKALLHPSHNRKQIALTLHDLARLKHKKSDQRNERKQVHRQSRTDKQFQRALSRKQEISHLTQMRHHVERRFGIGSVRHHPAFVAMRGNDKSCFFNK